ALVYASPFRSVSHTPPASARRIVAALGVTVGVLVGVPAPPEEPPLQPAVLTTSASDASASNAFASLRKGILVLVATICEPVLVRGPGSVRVGAAHRPVDAPAQGLLVHAERDGLLPRAIRGRRVAHERVGLREQRPAVDVVRLRGEPLLEATDE